MFLNEERQILSKKKLLNEDKFNKEILDALKKNDCDGQGITNQQNNILLVKQENQDLGFVGFPKE